MCQVTIYRNQISEENIVMKEVAGYEVDFGARSLMACTVLGDRRNFKLDNVTKIRWNELDDSLVIEEDR